MDLAHGNMEGTWGSVLPLPPGYKLPETAVLDFLPLLRNKAGILTASSTGSRSWSFNESIKFNITLD